MNKKGSGEPLDWAHPVPLILLKTKLIIPEALLSIDAPLTAGPNNRMGGHKIGTSSLSYHLRSLAYELPVLDLYDEERVRGAWRKLYYFRDRTPASKREA